MRWPIPVLALLVGLAAEAQESPRSGWAVVPIEEYRALHTKAFPPDPEPPPPPVEAVLGRVDYDLRVGPDSATGEARLSVDVFKEGWVAVAVPDGLRVSAARLAGRPVALVDRPGKAPGQAQVWLSKIGPALITLEIVVPVTAAAGTETLTLPAAPAALTRATLVLPRQGIDVTVVGGLLLESSEVQGQSRSSAAARPGEALGFSWRKKRDDRHTTQPLRLRGSVTELVGLSEDVAQLSAEVRLTVVQGQAAALQLALPEGVQINEVSGALVADWSADARVLRVSFLEPVEGEASLTLQGELRVPREGRLSVPLLRLADAERETGGVAVEVLGAGEIKRADPRALEAADPADLGSPVAGRDSPSLLAFRYRPQAGAAARALEVDVARYTPQAVLVANVEELRYRVLVTDDGKRLTQARYAVRNNQRSFLALTLPAVATLWSAAVDGRPVRPGKAPGGALLLPLRKGRAGEDAPASAVEVVYAERVESWQPQGRASLVLPGSDLPVSRTGLELYYPPRYRITLENGPLRLATYVPPSAPVLAAATVASEKQVSEDSRLDDGRDKARVNKLELKPADELQGLLERFQKEGRVKRAAGVVPLSVSFPVFGPALYLAAELTAEGAGPSVELTYKRGAK